jgi:hypothetical protein
MRTVLFLMVGFLLLGAAALLGKMFSANYPGAPYAATIAFVLLWFALSAFNFWVGVAKAGYAFTDELPIFLLIFGVPAVAAILIKWRFF